jgi:hypothetical protein
MMPKSENDQTMERISASVDRCSQLVVEMKRMLDELHRPAPRPQLALVRREEVDDGQR